MSRPESKPDDASVRRLEEIDGHLYDTETGEYVGVAGDQSAEFRVHDEQTAQWFGQRLSEIEASILSLEAQREAVNNHFDALVRQKQRHYEGMMFKYGDSLKQFAKSSLGKQKTYMNPYIRVTFRQVPEHYKATPLLSGEHGLTWAEVNCPGAIETKRKVMPSLVPTEIKAKFPAFFERTPERESVSVHTDIGG